MWAHLIAYIESLSDAAFVAMWILLCIPCWIAWDRVWLWAFGTSIHERRRAVRRQREAAMGRALSEQARRDIRARLARRLEERRDPPAFLRRTPGGLWTATPTPANRAQSSVGPNEAA